MDASWGLRCNCLLLMRHSCNNRMERLLYTKRRGTPSSRVTCCRGFSPTEHLWTAFSWVMVMQTGQLWHFWNLHESRIPLILFFSGENVFFYKCKNFHLHFFTEEIDSFEKFLMRNLLRGHKNRFQVRKPKCYVNVGIIADLAIRATTFKIDFNFCIYWVAI